MMSALLLEPRRAGGYDGDATPDPGGGSPNDGYGR